MLVRFINQLSSLVIIKENSLLCDILFMQCNEIVFIISVCVCAHIYFHVHVFHCSGISLCKPIITHFRVQ